MKSAKLLLILIGASAIAGGAIASKIHRGGGIIYVPCASESCDRCFCILRTLTTVANGRTPMTITCGTTILGAPGSAIIVYPTAQ